MTTFQICVSSKIRFQILRAFSLVYIPLLNDKKGNKAEDNIKCH